MELQATKMGKKTQKSIKQDTILNKDRRKKKNQEVKCRETNKLMLYFL